MAHDIYIVLTQPKPGCEAPYHQWYSGEHLPDLLRIPGIEAAHRYSLEQHFPSSEDRGLFLALYEFNNTSTAIEGILDRRGTSRLRSSDTLNRAATKGIVFSSISSKTDSPGSTAVTTLSEFSLVLYTINGNAATAHSGRSAQLQLPEPLSVFSGMHGVQVMHSDVAQVNAGPPPFQYALFMPAHMLPQAIDCFAESAVTASQAKAGAFLSKNIVFSARAL